MTYLGRKYSFMSDAEIAKKILTDSIQEALAFVSSLPISQFQRCHALNLQLRSQLSFPFSHYNISQTWIKANLDGLVTNKVRHWLELPPNATAHLMPLPTKCLGLDLIMPSMLAEICQLRNALTLRHSKDVKMDKLAHLVVGRVPFRDLLSTATRIKASETARKTQLEKHVYSFHSLKVESILHKALTLALSPSDLNSWSTNMAIISHTISNLQGRVCFVAYLPIPIFIYRARRHQATVESATM